MAAQAGLCLAWSGTPEDTFCRVVAHLDFMVGKDYSTLVVGIEAEVLHGKLPGHLQAQYCFLIGSQSWVRIRSDTIVKYQSKKIRNDQELIQSDPTSCPQNQKGNN